jgi:hypothetical protein
MPWSPVDANLGLFEVAFAWWPNYGGEYFGYVPAFLV